MNDRDEKETITQLKRELERMDDTFVPPVPQVFELNQRLARFKQERKRALKKELLCFIVMALVILSAYLTISVQVPAVFIMVQGAALILLPVLALLEKRRRAADGEAE
ncbi:YxlC family protein [Bacillus paralicheniformis]|uniref:YxlC family protein n=1 Tax=Bacillus paralicheniformis TaxID=1648923 RepID=A0ABY3FSL8_9BACI|nr:YxlC family protein [Bacillus paralicheniformis]MED1145148.1 YxlC family protein [Bacillus paralicheniformis]MED1191667.1 YxlC family protein [Bacillus paralicheniformis]MED1235918.1 YxlC family protein [Bacillus paralicheniformis]MED4310928.1 YxlC family protein [Bacillus paralicheniformis]MED4348547.1 YxlC family protein [Bacillus paralicheniformis]